MALCSQKRIQHTKLQPPGNNAIENAIERVLYRCYAHKNGLLNAKFRVMRRKLFTHWRTSKAHFCIARCPIALCGYKSRA